MEASPEHVALLVLRLWTETAADGFRARITVVDDLRDQESEIVLSADPDEVLRRVGELVRRFGPAAGTDDLALPGPAKPFRPRIV